MMSALVFEKPTAARPSPLRILLLPAFCLAPEVSNSEYEPSARSRPVMMKRDASKCIAMGMMKHMRQAQSIFSPSVLPSSATSRNIAMISGITRSVMPPPTLPHPPAVALTWPTMRRSKNWEHHTWHVTKVARERPMMKRPRMKPALPSAVMRMIIPGMATRRRKMNVLRTPNRSHMEPAMTRITMVPDTARLPAVLSVSGSRSRPPSSLGFFK
mmetsp:Transcript_17686/g.40591  ORF Transcript_17686/g.40591 Transcript_17686/m.40591 type:complete len:214 (-) Transcript_17686:48-689(-)